MVKALYSTLAAMLAGCSVGKLELRGAPEQPFDAIIVPGCPSRDDGRPSRCQLSRAIWAAILWERGWTKAFITSGSDVHTPFVEAEAIAQVMTALGVPADRIYLESEALHTDENMYFSLRIAEKLGLKKLAVASQRGHALWACRMMIDWGQTCSSITVDLDAVKQRRVANVEQLVARKSTSWLSLAEREHARALRSGVRRPPSWMLYPSIALLRAGGTPWRPTPPSSDVRVRTWAERIADELAASASPPASP